MEFLSYDDVRTRFASLHITEDAVGETVRLRLDLADAPVSRVVFGTPHGEPKKDDRTLEREKSDLPATVDGVLHRLHINEIALIPVGTWRSALDLAAFDLATDEQWTEFEAEASMHMNGRDALMFKSSDYSVALKIVAAVMEHGESHDADLTIVSLETPFVIDICHAGGLSVYCANESIADEVAQVSGAHDA